MKFPALARLRTQPLHGFNPLSLLSSRLPRWWSNWGKFKVTGICNIVASETSLFPADANAMNHSPHITLGGLMPGCFVACLLPSPLSTTTDTQTMGLDLGLDSWLVGISPSQATRLTHTEKEACSRVFRYAIKWRWPTRTRLCFGTGHPFVIQSTEHKKEGWVLRRPTQDMMMRTHWEERCYRVQYLSQHRIQCMGQGSRAAKRFRLISWQTSVFVSATL